MILKTATEKATQPPCPPKSCNEKQKNFESRHEMKRSNKKSTKPNHRKKVRASIIVQPHSNKKWMNWKLKKVTATKFENSFAATESYFVLPQTHRHNKCCNKTCRQKIECQKIELLKIKSGQTANRKQPLRCQTSLHLTCVHLRRWGIWCWSCPAAKHN